MPQPRRYRDAAAKQRAYRQRQEAARRAERAAKGLPPGPASATLPSPARWRALLEQARLALQTVHEEMQTYAEERSDAWQQSERAQTLGESVEAVERALDELPTLCVKAVGLAVQRALGDANGLGAS
jgi:hypothetical protein